MQLPPTSPSPSGPGAAPSRASPFLPAARVALGLAVVLTLAWVWFGFCLYPAPDWNAMRLAPSFMLRAGLSPYPGPLEGPVTTWIYGPIPILLQLPATLARNVTTALLSAGAINLFLTLVPSWIAVRATLPPAAPRHTFLWAGLLATAAWPAAHLIYCQADNAAVAFGLLGIVAIAGAAPGASLRLWLGALAAAASLWSKQTELAPLLGQFAFLFIRQGGRAALVHLVRCVAAGALLGAGLLPLCGAEGLLYNMFVLPADLPRTEFFAKLVHPVYRTIYRSYLIIHLVLPVAVIALGARRFFRRDSPVLLPVLMFTCGLPFNLAGFASIGGNINSLHGVLYVLPAAAAWLAGWPRWRPGGIPVGLLLILTVMLAAQGAGQWPLPWRPDIRALQQAESLARQLPGQVYFPWNPLVNYYAGGRFDHAEDGFMTRLVAGRPVPDTVIRRYLPPAMCVVAYHRQVNDGLVVKMLIPPGARRVQFGEWILFSWPPPIEPDGKR